MSQPKQAGVHAKTRSREATEVGHSCQPTAGLENPYPRWEMAPIGDLTLRTKLRNPSRDPEKRFSYVDVSSVSNTSFRITAPTELPGAEAPSRARKVIRTGDVLFATVRPTLKRVSLVPEELNDQIASTGFIVLRADASRLDSGYLYYQLLTDEFIQRMRELERGASYPAVRDSDIYNEKISLPPLAEQQKIAAVLGLVQRAFEQQERLIQLTAELKKVLLHQLFTAGLRGEPQKETEIGLMPQSWSPTPIGTCCDILSGSLPYTDFLNMAPSDEDDAVECMGVKVSDMNLPGNEGQFVTANQVKRLPVALARCKLIPPNTVVFPKRGAAIATNKKRLTTTWTVLDPNLIGIRAKDVLDAEFLFHWSQTFDLRKITDPGSTPQLNKKDLIPVAVPLPSDIDEQREIAQTISCVDSKQQYHQQKKAALADLFRTLLHQLMTAQIRVHDLTLSDAPGLAEAHSS